MTKKSKGSGGEKIAALVYNEEIEREEAKQYVLTKILERPKTNVFSIIFLFLIYISVSVGTGFFIKYIVGYKNEALVFVGVFLIYFIVFLRVFCIVAVKAYQHYAKEERRRKCVCKPTCSEYAIAVLKKYPVFIALHKIRVRLFKTCKDDYKIDLP